MMYLEPPGPSIIRLLAIDPGTDTLGIGVLDVDMDKDYAPRLVFATTIKASKLVSAYEWESEVVGKRDVRLRVIGDLVYDFLCAAQPHLIAAESPFLQFGRVQAYEALVECYAMLRKTLWNYSKCMTLRRIDPITAKNSVGVSHIGTDKDDVKAAIVERYKDKTDIDLDALDEHSTDAVAVAHCLYRQLILKEDWSSTKKKKKRGRGFRRKRGGKKK